MEHALRLAAQGDFGALAPFKQRPCIITLLDAIPEVISPTLYAHWLPDPLLYQAWYLERALTMERLTGNVKSALELLEVALARKEVSSLAQLRDSFLVYDALLNFLPEPQALSLTFAEFADLFEQGIIPAGWTREVCKSILLNERCKDLSSAAIKALYQK